MTSEQALRRMRQNIFNYPPEKEAQAQRVLLYLKKRSLRLRKAPKVGPYSGLTRQELRRSGTCETDWV